MNLISGSLLLLIYHISTSFAYTVNVSKCCNSFWKNEEEGKRNMELRLQQNKAQTDLKMIVNIPVYDRHPHESEAILNLPPHLASDLSDHHYIWNHAGVSLWRRVLVVCHSVECSFMILIMEIIWHRVNSPGSSEILPNELSNPGSFIPPGAPRLLRLEVVGNTSPET